MGRERQSSCWWMRVAVAGGVSGETARGPERHWEEESSALQRDRSREENRAAASSLWSGDEAQVDSILCLAGGGGGMILTPVLGPVLPAKGDQDPATVALPARGDQDPATVALRIVQNCQIFSVEV